ncbi:MAG: T9SS type A sorting domain-containing protein [Rhodothermales bacterium]|nr:T9SS type A sorting domain-containing protein [Rhodothermales bacterium]
MNPRNGDVEITLFDMLGRRVLAVDRGSLASGRHQQIVDMTRFASGVYLYKIRVVGDRTVRFTVVGKTCRG